MSSTIVETTYEWAKNYRGNRKVNPALVADAVEAIREREGVCQPSSLVERARPLGSELHDLFTWNDSEAAENWRRDEARHVIRGYRIVGEEDAAPLYVSVKMLTEAGVIEGYVPTVRAMNDPELSKQVLAEAVSNLRGWQNRYQSLQELQPVFHAIDEIEMPE